MRRDLKSRRGAEARCVVCQKEEMTMKRLVEVKEDGIESLMGEQVILH